MALVFEATFRLPGDANPLHVKLPTWRNPDAKVDRGDGPLEAAVYDAMTTSAFAQFTSKFLATFFNKPDVPLEGDTRPASALAGTLPAKAAGGGKPAE